MKTANTENLELIMVLGGENARERPRSNKALEVYKTYGRIPILLTGSHSGFNYQTRPPLQESLGYQMRKYLLKKDVRDEDILVQDKSRDTLEDFYFSKNLVQGKNRIGLITDSWQMNRGLWCGCLVFGKNPQFVPVSTNWESNLKEIIQDKIVHLVMSLDLSTIRRGDFEALTKYMESKHPYYSISIGNKLSFSAYGLMIKIAKRTKLNLRDDAEMFE